MIKKKNKLFWMIASALKKSIIFQGLSDVLLIIIPTYIAFLTGDILDNILSMNGSAIKSHIVPFIIALFIGIVVEPVISMADCVIIFKESLKVDMLAIKNFLKKDYSEVTSIDSGQFNERFNGDLIMYKFVIIFLVSQPFVILVYGVYVISALKRESGNFLFIALVFLASALPLIRSYIQSKIEADYEEQKQEFLDEQKKLEIMYYKAHDFIKINNLAGNMIELMRSSFKNYYNDVVKKMVRINTFKNVLEFFTEYASSLLILIAGCILMARGAMSMGAIMGAVLILPSILLWYNYISRLITYIKLKDVYENRLKYFEVNEKNEREKIDSFDILEVKDVSFSYGEKEVIKHVSMSIKNKEHYMILGPNGCGKSTIAKLLSGMYMQSAGDILIDGNRVNLTQMSAYASQDAYLFKGSLFENICFDTKTSQEEVRTLLDSLGMSKYPLDYQIEEQGKNLSVGEKQKINLVRAILKDSTLLILDEPTNNLDVAAQNYVAEVLEKTNRSLIVITHDQKLIDRLNNGAWKTFALN